MKTIIKILKKNYITIILLLSILFLYGFTLGQSKSIDELETEIAELDLQKENLLIQKQLYEEVIELYEEIEEILNQQVGILEIDIEGLQEENEHLRMIRAKLTAYSPLDNRDGQQAEGDPNKTSIGKKVSRGIVAADPKKLPYGTKLEIPNWGIVEVGDTGGALRSDNRNIRIDLFHNTFSEAMRFGVKDLEVKILEWGGN